jgi:hypothetical protein
LLEYVFEVGEQNSPNAVTKEKAAEIAADFMMTFYHVQVGALESQEFRTMPVPYWLFVFLGHDETEAMDGLDRVPALTRWKPVLGKRVIRVPYNQGS